MTQDVPRTLTVIPGGKASSAAGDTHALDRQLAALNALPAKRRRDALLEAQRPEELVRAMPAPDFFWLVKELGLADSAELVELAAPEQLAFCLDLDVWESWTPQPERMLTWLQSLLEGKPDAVVAVARQLDRELLILLLRQEIQVGGGLQLLADEDEPTGSWEQTFDNIYFFNYTNKEHAAAISQFLELLHQRDNQLYVNLLEGVKSELTADLEEECLQFRTGRLGDYGFPPLTEAMAIYAYLDPDTYRPALDKERDVPLPECAFLPIALVGDDLFSRALASAAPAVAAELHLLFNHALVAEAIPFADSDEIVAVCRRVRGYLNLALEHVCGEDLQRAVAVLEGEPLRRLCQLGYSLVGRVRRQAEALSRGDLLVNRAAERALDGVMQRHPRFYRGFDPDMVDNYREFRNSADLLLVEEFIDSLVG